MLGTRAAQALHIRVDQLLGLSEVLSHCLVTNVLQVAGRKPQPNIRLQYYHALAAPRSRWRQDEDVFHFASKKRNITVATRCLAEVAHKCSASAQSAATGSNIQ